MKISLKDWRAGNCPPPVEHPWQLCNLTTGCVHEPFYKDAVGFRSLLKIVTDCDRMAGVVWELRANDPRVVQFFNAEIERKLSWREVS